MKAALRSVLIIVGLLTLIPCGIGVFLPWEKVISYAGVWGMELPKAIDSPITVYLCRLLCVTYFWVGVLFLVAAVDPLKHLTLTRFLALASVFVGLTCILAGTSLGLPVLAYLIDGIFCMAAGGLIWTLSSQMGRAPKQEAAPAESGQ